MVDVRRYQPRLHMTAPSTPEGKIRGRFSAGPSRLELNGLYLLLGVHLVLASDAAIPDGWLGFAIVSFSLIVGWFSIRMIMALLRVRSVRPYYGRLIEAGCILAAVLVLHATTVALAARVYLSQPELRDLAMDSMTTRASRPFLTRGGPSGLFTIHAITSKGGVVWLGTVSGSRLFPYQYADQDCQHAGLAYCETGRPPAMPPSFSQSFYHHLYGPWWLWMDSEL
jgi:hypothetical protein